MGQAADFFVSYTSADRAWAEWIAWQLEADGYQVVFQGWDFTPGHDWAYGMQQAITTAERLVVVLSAAYLQSGHGEAEWRAFYAKDPSGDRGLLLPVRVSDVEPPGLLKTRIYVDLVGRDANIARATLLAAARRVRGKPTSEPEFPGMHGQSMSHGTEEPQFPGEPESQTLTKSPHDPRSGQTLARSSRPPRSVLPPELLQALSSEVAWWRVGTVAELGRPLHAQPGEMAAQARAVLQQLIDDDSRSVSQATIRALSTRPSAHWTRGKVELLHAELAYPGARALLDEAARRTPKSVSLLEMSQRTSSRTEQLSAELGAMTKLSKRLFGQDAWPMTVRSSPDGATYHMDPEIAEWWRQASDRAAQPVATAAQLPTAPHPSRPAPASATVDLRNRFFGQVLDRIGEQRPGFRPPKLRSKHYIAFGAGPFGHYAVSFIHDGRLRVGVLVEMQTADLTKRLFDLLVADRMRIEQELGEQLDWDRNDPRIRSWFGLHRPAPDLTDEQQSAYTASWAADTITKLMAGLDMRLRREALRLRDAAAAPATSPSGPSSAGTPGVGSESERLTEALQIAGLVAADRQQRAVPLEFAGVEDAAAYRDRLRLALAERAAAGDVAIGHVRPWGVDPD